MKKKAVCMLLTAGLGLASEFIPVTDNVLETDNVIDVTENVAETSAENDVIETETVDETENEEIDVCEKTEFIDQMEAIGTMETLETMEIIEKMENIEELSIIPEEIPEIEEVWQPPSESEPCTVYFDNGNMEIISAENPAQYEDWANRVENRNGKLVIDVIYGTVLDENGNGEDVTGHYIKYDPERFEVGDMVETYLIYNPDNNALDGMEMRIDYLKEGEGF